MATYLPGVTDFIPDIQPFQPDWGTVDKTMRLKQGTYDQNYASLQGTYSGLLNMPQLKQDQIAKRDKFLKQAFKNLGDLSSVDLSLPENVASANNVFAPLYQDGDFLGNSAISKHYEQQEQIADGFRLKDGGKEYSQDNLNYVRKQKGEYINDQSPDAWKRYYSNKRSYEPYYNASQEIKDVMEKFKPSQIAYTKMNGMYFVKTDDKSWREEEIKGYLNGVLSDKAKRQLQIEADVRLGNTATIVGMYKESANKDLQFNNSKLAQIESKIKEAKTPEERSQLQDLKIQYNHQNEELASQVAKIDSGDIDFIKSNQEGLAYKMYYNGMIDRTAKAFAHRDVKEDITENSVALGMWKDGQEWGRLRFTQANTNARFGAEMQYKYAALAQQKKKDDAEAGTVNGEAIITNIPSGPADVTDPKSISGLQKQIEEAKDRQGQESLQLNKHIGIILGKPAASITSNDVHTYMTSARGQADPKVKSFVQTSKSTQLLVDDADNSIKQAEDYALSKMPAGFGTTNARLNTVLDKMASTDSSVLIDEAGNRVTITPRRLLELKTDKQFSISPSRGGNFNISINGKQYREMLPRDARVSKIGLLSNDLNNFVNNNAQVKQFNKYKADYFGQKQIGANQAITFADNDPRIKNTKNVIASISGIDLTKIREVAYSPRADNNRVSFTVDDPKQDADAIKNKLISKGFDVEYNEGMGTYIINNGNLNSSLDPFSKMPAYGRQLISTLQTRVGKDNSVYQSTYFDFNVPKSVDDGSKFRIDKHFDGPNSSYYLYREKNGKAVPLATSFNDAYSAYQFSQQLAVDPTTADTLFK